MRVPGLFFPGQVPSCLRNLDWRGKPVKNIPLFPLNQTEEQLEPCWTKRGLERKKKSGSAKTAAAYTLIKGGKGGGEEKGSRISVQIVAHLYHRGYPILLSVTQVHMQTWRWQD